MRSSPPPLLAAVAALVAACLIPGLSAPAHAAMTEAAPLAGSAAVDPGAGPASGTVTLITGDEVTVNVLPDGSPGVVFRPGEGRDGMPFTQSVKDGEVSVVPFDAQRLLDTGALDPALFDVSHLLDNWSAGSGTLPLIVSYPSAGAVKEGTDDLRTDGAQVKRALPSVNAVAATVARKETAGFWKGINPTAPAQAERLADGIAKISLDGTARPLDVESVQQIGAPAAWRRGLTGAGVKVAVLDSGIDAAHPDLAGRIGESRDFTASPTGVADTQGHGTHVAGIIAGTGPQPGVAPGVTLMIGRVCLNSGCPNSAIIAGMEWAAASGAKVVNLSLGGAYTDGTDPMSQSLNALTAKYGTLFVVAAGNAGHNRTVSTPGSADAALTVGSVTKDGQLSTFSSRGPRVGDDAVKPEISAPGYSIAAARAAGTSMGLPLDDRYTLLSGTSMATPHVVGAAAILAGQHPGWSAARLKAALVSTAEPIEDATVFEQGVGVVDVDRATSELVRAEPATLNLGTTATGTITYRNDGDRPVKLKLDVPNGSAFTLDRRHVEVPPNGEAQVTVKAEGTGTRGALVTARAGQDVVRSAVSATSAPVTHQITVNTVDRDGVTNGRTYGFVVYLARHETGEFYGGGTYGRPMQGPLPEGRYTAFAWIPTRSPAREPWYPSFTLVAKPVTLDKDAEVTLDARDGVKVATTLNGTEADGVSGTAFGLAGTGQVYASQATEAYVAPAETPGMVYTAAQYLRGVAGSTACGPDGAAVCNIGVASETGPVATHPVITDADLAKVRADAGTQGGRGGADRIDYAVQRGSAAPPAEPIRPGEWPLPGTLTSYFHGTGPVGWSSVLYKTTPKPAQLQNQAWRQYAGGQEYTEQWLSGVLGPVVGTTAPNRLGNVITATLPLLSDPSPGHYAYATWGGATGRTELYRDGKIFAGGLTPNGAGFQVPSDRAHYRLVMSATRQADVSTKVEAAWEFDSKATRETTALPLLAVRFSPQLDGDGSAPAGGVFQIPFQVDRTATAGPVREVGVEASFDDGATWTRAEVRRDGDGGTVTITHPDLAGSSGYVSLRASAGDVHGNTVTQDIVRAYRLR
ncbi:S8 family serine peptidase [Planotetraspora sp. A-T 1434]|uniref:S8 family serine peptidase n=1 Tax=Planotetraspora sp. A-T 1434 TaxID=2979219 RepID=UPI0021C01EAC|nr:S8 family serine peptidase [Planotetraspora sp. A-T 1434]MCT9932740.1 S8 family serine peptidase [Planotetraspora sp. A-T 1434]